MNEIRSEKWKFLLSVGASFALGFGICYYFLVTDRNRPETSTDRVPLLGWRNHVNERLNKLEEDIDRLHARINSLEFRLRTGSTGSVGKVDSK